MFPLLQLTSSRRVMGERRNGLLLAILGWSSALFILAMDLYGSPGAVTDTFHIASGRENAG